MDPELLAALLDGRLSHDERNRVLAALAESEDGLHHLAEAAAIAAEVTDAAEISEHAEASDSAEGGAHLALNPPPTVRSISSAPSAKRSGRWYLWLLAPSLAAAALLFIVRRPSGERGASASSQFMAQAAPVLMPDGATLTTQLGSDWLNPGWAVVRGEGASLSRSALAFRIGVRSAELTVALRAADESAVRRVVPLLAALARAVDSGAPVALIIEGVTDSVAFTSVKDRLGVINDARLLASDDFLFDLGAFAETTRLAQGSGVLSRLVTLAPTRAELDRLVRASTQAAPSDSALARYLSRAKAAIASTVPDVGAFSASMDSVLATGAR
ncbi:MAG: hypothetical protein ABIP93_12840 [Gemmatimonadaceae bacterium]